MKHFLLFIVGAAICSNMAAAQNNPDLNLNGGSRFQFGFARVERDSSSYYINVNGDYSFDQIVGCFNQVDSVSQSDYGYEQLHENKKKLMLLVRKKGKTGVVNDPGQWVLSPIYDTIELKWKTYLALRQNGKMTYADTHGKLLLPLEFEDAGILDDDHFDVKQNGKWGVYSVSEKKLIIPAEYDGFDYCGGCGDKGSYVFTQKNKSWGVVDFKNKILVPFEYEHNHYNMRSDGWVCCFKKKGKDIIINIPLGKEYGSPEFSDMEITESGLLKLKKDGKYGLLNAAGKQLMDFEYDDIKDPYDQFHSGPYLVIEKNKKQGIINNAGKMITQPEYSGDISVAGNYFIVTKNGKKGLLDSVGKELLPAVYNDIEAMILTDKDGSEKLFFKVKEKALYGFFNPAILKLIAPAFLDVDFTNLGDSVPTFIEVSYQGKKGLYSMEGIRLMPMNYESYKFLSDHSPFNLLEVKNGEKKGVYDLQQQKEIVPPEYNSIKQFDTANNIILAGKEVANYGKIYSVYDTKTGQVLPLAYQNIDQLNKDYFLLTKKTMEKESWSLWNRKTNKNTPLSYRNVKICGDSVLLVVSDNMFTYLYDIAAQKILSGKYPVNKDADGGFIPSVSAFQSGIAKVVQQGKFGFIDATGKVVVPISYDVAELLKNGCILLAKKAENDKWVYGYADSTGKVIVPLMYDYDTNAYASDYNGNLFLPLYKINDNRDKYLEGRADLKGKVLIPPIYNVIYKESSGNGFLVKQGDKFGILDTAGGVIIPLAYNDVLLDETIDNVSNTVRFSFPLLCQKDNKFQYISKSGKLLPYVVKEVTEFISAGENPGILVPSNDQ